MKGARQTTLRDHTAVFGIGVHSGLSATLTLHPADANSGITILRAGTAERPEREIRADVRAVTATEFATVLGDSSGRQDTVALAGAGGMHNRAQGDRRLCWLLGGQGPRVVPPLGLLNPLRRGWKPRGF